MQNRHLQPDGTWQNGTETRARIVPVCDGKAVLEEWAGPFSGTFMNGFSLRSYDPATRQWVILLFWTTDGNAGFGRMRGAFRHGRGEFLSSPLGAGASSITRYTFSDGLADSVRWDQARTQDGGQTWRTDWIMEFRRTRPAAEVTQDVLFGEDWNAGTLSPHASARRLDWLVGRWEGTQTDATTGETREARLSSRLLDKDCLVLDVLETRRADEEDWHHRVAIRGFVAQRGAWESWTLSEDDPVLRQSLGQPDAEGAQFEGTRPDGTRWRETWVRLGDTEAVVEMEEAAPGAELELARATELWRTGD